MIALIKNFLNKYTVIRQFIYSCLRRKRYFFIVTYAHDAQRTIENCLQSVYEQDYNCYNHYIINDASNDSTGEIVKRWIKKHPGNKVIYRAKETKSGYGHCCVEFFNQAISSSIIMELSQNIQIKAKDYLSCLNKVYFDQNVFMTYSMFKYDTNHKTHLLRKFETSLSDINSLQDSMWVTESLYTFKKKLFCFIKEESLKDPQTGNYRDNFWKLSYVLPLLEIAEHHLQYLDKEIYLDEKKYYLNENDFKSKKYKKTISEIPKHFPIKNLSKSDVGYICGHHPYADRFVYGVMSNLGINIDLLDLNEDYSSYKKILIPNGFLPKIKPSTETVAPEKRIFIEVAFFPQLKNVYLDNKGIHGYSSVRDAKLVPLTPEHKKELEQFRDYYTSHSFTKIGETFIEYDIYEGNGKYEFPFIFVPLQMESDTAYDFCPFNNNQEIVSFIEHCFPDRTIIFKNHPNWPAEYKIKKGNILLPVDNRDLRELMVKADYIVAVNSTVLLEGLMHGKICASLGEGFSTNFNVCLECHKDRNRLKVLPNWKPDWNKVDMFLYYLLQKQIRLDFWKDSGETQKALEQLKFYGVFCEK